MLLEIFSDKAEFKATTCFLFSFALKSRDKNGQEKASKVEV